MDITDTLLFRFQARYPVIWLESFDDPRVYRILKNVCKAEDYNLYRWSLVDGLVELGLNLDTVLPVGDKKMDAQQMLSELLNRMDSYDKEIFIMEGPDDLLSYMDVKILLKKIAIDMPRSRKPMHLILISPEARLPYDLARYVDVLSIPECEKEDYGLVLDSVASEYKLSLSQALREKLVDEAEGLTSLEAQRIYALAASETSLEDEAVNVLRRERARIEKKMDILNAGR